MPSITIWPYTGSNILNRQLINVDLPAPVLPTMPALCPFYIFRVILLITKGSPSRYLVENFLNSMFPYVIAFKSLPYYLVLHFLQYSAYPGSGSNFEKVLTLSIAIIFNYKLA